MYRVLLGLGSKRVQASEQTQHPPRHPTSPSPSLLDLLVFLDLLLFILQARSSVKRCRPRCQRCHLRSKLTFLANSIILLPNCHADRLFGRLDASLALLSLCDRHIPFRKCGLTLICRGILELFGHLLCILESLHLLLMIHRSAVPLILQHADLPGDFSVVQQELLVPVLDRSQLVLKRMRFLLRC